MTNPFAKAYRITHNILYPIFSFFHPVEVVGAENLPEGPVLMCGNHSSAWDPIQVIMALPKTFPLRIMAKKQLFRIPLIGPFLTAIGVFPVDRGNSDINAVKTSIKSLNEGFTLLLFPEGTRVKAKGQVQPKSGAAVIAVRSGVPMVPVFIGTKKRLFRKTKVIFGKPFDPVYTGRKGTAEEMQANVDEVMRQSYALGGM